MVLPADDVGDPEQVVVHRDREVHQREDRGIDPRVRGCVHDPHRREVPHRRVRVGEIRLHPDGRVALVELAIEHLLPEVQVLIRRPLPAGARLPLELEFSEPLGVADTDVGAPELDEPPAPVVVDVEPVALVDDIGDVESQPLDILKHHPVGLGVDPPGVGILDAEDVPAAVAPDVVVVQDGSPRVPEVQRSARVRRKPHDDAVLRPFEGGKFAGTLVRPGELLEEFGGEFQEKALSLRRGDRRHLRDRIFCKRPDIASPAPKLGVFPEHYADDRTALRGAAVFHRVLQGVDEEQVPGILIHGISCPGL
ncbi:MAG: hypothetical protein BWX50_00602 [Euryarchaeota archaeon ADurb.Bin009]|nr:MAG: hypothetical protein BWX50_00602 [Euryarchaeota archaeon ADurb.Bin009]